MIPRGKTGDPFLRYPWPPDTQTIRWIYELKIEGCPRYKRYASDGRAQKLLRKVG
jgi:hypothetical protein